MLIALTQEQSTLALILFIVLAIDVIMLVLGAGLAVVFVAFKLGTAILAVIDKVTRLIVNTAFRLVEDALESPPLDKVPLFQWALIGVKKAYDLFNVAQAALMFALNIVVLLVAFAVAAVFVTVLVALNVAALWTIVGYVT